MIQLALRTLIILATAVGGGFAAIGIPNEVLTALGIGSRQDPIGRALLGIAIGFVLGFALGMWIASWPGAKTMAAGARWQQAAGAAAIAVVACGFVLFVVMK